MTTINTNSDAYSALGLNVPQQQRSKSLGQADFLRLMTEQLKNQDPLKPLDNNQFLGQLAQFSTVQGIDKMQNAMESVASVMESDQALRAASLVGHNALIEASTLDVEAGASVNGEVTAPSAGPIQFEIVDASGARVRTMRVDATGKGALGFQWDGKNDAGQSVGAGRYTIKATAGSNDALTVSVSAKVDSVSIGADGLVLNLAHLGSHPLSSIRRIG